MHATLILPTHLTKSNRALDKQRPVIFYEHPQYFRAFRYHKQKLMFHRASMKAWQHHLNELGYTTHYLEYHEQLEDFLIKKHIIELHSIRAYDETIADYYQTIKKTIKLTVYDSDYFINTPEKLEESLESQASLLMTSFYRKQRINHNILLIKQGKPQGGKWSFDAENRLKLPKNFKVPQLLAPKETVFIFEARAYIEKNFKNNPGSTTFFYYPTTHIDAQIWLIDFFKQRFSNFGTYQDAISYDHPFMFHSLLSPLLNAGLLAPQDVINQALEYAQEHATSINNLEGFIRQILGWREFVFGVYNKIGKKQASSNFFNHTHKLPESFWQATTGIIPVDNAIENTLNYAYAHHIQRLMILGNFMLLCQIDPHEVYTWFMELYIDAHDWVMVPNVYGMSQYADGGLIVTKPYISGSNYVKKMSDFKDNGWGPIWDALFWRFIAVNHTLILSNPRLKILGYYLQKMNKHTLNSHISLADKFLSVFL